MDFEAITNASGHLLFKNIATGEEQADQPAFGWVKVVGENKEEDPYYWNVGTGATQWEVPS